MTNIKKCPACNIEKSHDEFYRASRRGGSLSSYCKPCSSARGKAQRAAMKHGGKEYDLKSIFNMTIEVYESMLREQGGTCAICDGVSENGRSLAVDHDRTCCPGRRSCGKCVRGLLCNKCNQGLGYFNDDVERIRVAIWYLEH